MKFLKRNRKKKPKVSSEPEANFHSIQRHVEKYPKEYPSSGEIDYMQNRHDALSIVNKDIDSANSVAEIDAIFSRFLKPPLAPFSENLAKRWTVHYEFEQETARKLHEKREELLGGRKKSF